MLKVAIRKDVKLAEKVSDIDAAERIHFGEGKGDWKASVWVVNVSTKIDAG